MKKETQKKIDLLRGSIGQYFFGHNRVVELLLISLIAGGHVLIEGVPGIGKTHLVRVLSGLLNLSSDRIQFGPDTQPSDITGQPIWNFKESKYIFYPGPIFNNIVLADEINRAHSRVKAALLAPMEEGIVSIPLVGEREVPKPFMVLATQNPIETSATEELGAAELDRFLLKSEFEWAKLKHLKKIVDYGLGVKSGKKTIKEIKPVLEENDLQKISQEMHETVKISTNILDFICRFVDISRRAEEYSLMDLSNQISSGASDRAAILLSIASKAHAFLMNRDYVTFSDVEAIIKPVLIHRFSGLFLKTGATKPSEVIKLLKVSVPMLGGI